MKVPKRINDIRRNVMHRITKNIGRSHKEPVFGSLHVEAIKNVLIVRPNHRLGNQLLLTPIVQEVINTFPYCKIDLFVKGGVAFPVFENYDQIHQIIPLPKKPFNNLFTYMAKWIGLRRRRYDLVINADRNSASGRLLTQISKANFKVFGEIYENIQKVHSDYHHIAKYPVYNLRYYLSQLGIEQDHSDVPVLDIKLSEDEISRGKAILDGIINNDKKSICIYTNATGDKCYSETWWETLYDRLLDEYPDYNVIEMLPIENISKIHFKAPNFYSKDIREMGAIIANTSIFIAADNGVMHLASAALTPTVGFFSVTNPLVYAPYGNGSIALDTNSTTIEDWIKAITAILGT
ncbi:glycosyltransferase family 9 protein [Aestuariivivens sediminis]|uniref:glycosyltransferase family 9 protein n=1 Tax=Aestuariivivens sediminis TaxID=2913557 RepID=UPI001F5830A8|nr:glycosyltransferase family 9 protein [Aestuariivivens sediminis]